jgi:aminoglycoside/choline kinase family phosphotransferase
LDNIDKDVSLLKVLLVATPCLPYGPEKYFNELPHFDTPEFKEAYPLMAVQRHTKVIGIFVRLFARDKKDKYLKHIPFVWSLLEKHLSNPLLQEYKQWLDMHVPQHIRGIVPFVNEGKNASN